MQGLVQAMQTQAHTQAALQAQLEAQTGGRDAAVSRREKGFTEEACSYVPATGQEESSVPGTAVSSNNQQCTGTFSTFPWCEEGVSPLREDAWGYRVLDDCGKVLEVWKQRPQDQGLSETSAGSPARSASPRSGSSSSASYRKTRKASSPSSSFACFDPANWSSSGDLQQLEASWSLKEGFPDSNLLWRSTKNPKEWCFGGFLGLPKESFISFFDPFKDLFRGKFFSCPGSSHFSFFWRSGLVGDPTSLEETVESDSERGE
ncbi:hypothetical protein Taro_015050 [Colocasia esculenta]|uniref:Uncharacterized protein n=1 Tax=Colocasia esculenta TaxID=4460 RepID=A0A843UKD9_COLES|nr:hypothetical protein [Colocasia esculenta]